MGGEWLPVCADALKDSGINDRICEEQSCGQHIPATLDYFRERERLDQRSNRVISSIECSAPNQKSLSDCRIKDENKQCKLGGLRCSSKSVPNLSP